MNNNKKKKILVIIISVLTAAVLVAVIYDSFFGTEQSSGTDIAMGSVVTVTAYGRETEGVAKAVIEEIQNVENKYISRKVSTSEIGKLNSQSTLEVSEFTKDVISKSIEVSKKSDGAFDITIGKLSALWDFDDDTEKVPSEDNIKNALSSCDYKKIRINGKKITKDSSQIIDLGAVGKGLACDATESVLINNNITGAVISVGGTVLVYGKNPGKDVWKVAIKSPDASSDSNFATITIDGGNVISTSGSYEKCFTKDGKLYHHILSTSTGYPVESGLKSVTVISSDGLISDALSTACFALGYEKSLNLLKEYNAKGIFVTNGNKVFATDKSILTLTDSNYSYAE